MPTTSTMTDKSLYERLGGEPAVTAVVDDFVARAAREQCELLREAGVAVNCSALINSPYTGAMLLGSSVIFALGAAGLTRFARLTPRESQAGDEDTVG